MFSGIELRTLIYKAYRFQSLQIYPVLLTSALLDRMHNNFLTLEVWNKTGGTQEDQV